MKKSLLAAGFLCAFVLGPAPLKAATPGILSYQGRVLVSGAPFMGMGLFKFALVDSTGATTYWSNDGTSAGGSEPAAAVSLNVANGLYSVLLGDTSIGNMTVAIPASVFSNTDVRLRVWFNDGTNNSKLLAPDQRIAAVGYALAADTAGTVYGKVYGYADDSGSGVNASSSTALAPAASFSQSEASSAQSAAAFFNSGGGRCADFLITSATNFSPAVSAVTNGTGAAVQGATNGTGAAANFVKNTSNLTTQSSILDLSSPTNAQGFAIAIHSSQQAFLYAHANGTSFARIDNNGTGFFNGGTQNSGADVAEAFQVVGDRKLYEPGDVLILSTAEVRKVEKSCTPYSTLVSGVHATKPGVLLTERNIDADASDLVPMGVVGVIPTKVCTENGAIKIGDLLVSSSTPGHAMKGTDRERMMGAIIGKAMENFNGPGNGKIQVLVNVK